MWGTALAIGDESQDELNERLPRDVDYVLLGGNARACGCIQLKPRARGETGLEIARAAEAPEIVLDHLGKLIPRVERGVDRARKRDIANLGELVELVAPAFAVWKGKWQRPKRSEELDTWLARVGGWVEEASPATWLAVYHVHT